MGIVDDDGIYIGNVYATLHYVGTYQHIVFTIYKIEYSFFQLMTFKLSVGKANAQVRAFTLYHGSHLAKTMYPVVNKEHLPSPFGLIINSIANSIGAKGLHFGLYGLPVRRWRVDDAQISCTH